MVLSKLSQNCFMKVSERNWLNNVQTLCREGAILGTTNNNRVGLQAWRLAQPAAAYCRLPAGVIWCGFVDCYLLSYRNHSASLCLGVNSS